MIYFGRAVAIMKVSLPHTSDPVLSSLMALKFNWDIMLILKLCGPGRWLEMVVGKAGIREKLKQINKYYSGIEE